MSRVFSGTILATSQEKGSLNGNQIILRPSWAQGAYLTVDVTGETGAAVLDIYLKSWLQELDIEEAVWKSAASIVANARHTYLVGLGLVRSNNSDDYTFLETEDILEAFSIPWPHQATLLLDNTGAGTFDLEVFINWY